MSYGNKAGNMAEQACDWAGAVMPKTKQKAIENKVITDRHKVITEQPTDIVNYSIAFARLKMFKFQ